MAQDTAATAKVHNPGAIGIIRDVEPWLLPPEAWSDGLNVRCRKGKVQRMAGHSQVFGTPGIAPGFVLQVQGAAGPFWLYANTTTAYVYDGSAHTDITRSAGASPYTATDELYWNGCILGGVPILNNGFDVPQYWPTLSAGTDLANLANWPATLRCKVMRTFGPFLIALNLTSSGTAQPHRLRWSHRTDPGSVPNSWDTTDATKDAGERELIDIEGGVIQDGLALFDRFIIYKQRSAHIMRFVGGTEIMGFDLLFAGAGLLAPRCVAAFDEGRRHFCVGESEIYVHAGTVELETVAEAKVREAVFAEIDGTNFPHSFCFNNAPASEVWFCYPTSGNAHPNRALVYNYKYGTWVFRDFVGMSASAGSTSTGLTDTWDGGSGSWDSESVLPWSSESKLQLVIADPTNSKFWQLESGYAFGTTTPQSYVERTGLAIVGRDRQGQPKLDFDRRKLVKRIWPHVKGGPIRVRVGAQEFQDGAVDWGELKDFDPATQKYLDYTANGRLIAVRFEGVDNNYWELGGYDLDMDVLGVL